MASNSIKGQGNKIINGQACRPAYAQNGSGYNWLANYEGGKIMSIDRSEVSRALAKAIAYKNCGKQAEAEAWAKKLVRLLECAEILR